LLTRETTWVSKPFACDRLFSSINKWDNTWGLSSMHLLAGRSHRHNGGHSILLLLFLPVYLGWAGSPQLHAQDDAKVAKIYAAAKSAQAAGDLNTAIGDYRELIRISPDLVPAYNNLGMLYEQTRQYPEAVTVLKRAHELNPKLPSISALLGIAYSGVGDNANARLALETALKGNPQDANAELLLCRVLLRTQEYESALPHLRKLSNQQPDNQEIWFLLGQAYMHLSQSALGRMRAINPDSAVVHEMSGQLMEDLKNYDGALLEYKKALQMSPNDADLHYRLGIVYWDLSQWDPALSEFREELRIDPSDCDAHAKIGNILLEQEPPQPAEALTEAETSLSKCPNLLQGHVVRGEALFRLKRNDEAILELKKVVTISPDDQGAHFFLAQAYRATGDKQHADAELQIYSGLEAAARQRIADRAQEVTGAAEKNP